MDIIYAAVPDNDITSSYYIDNILATIAHELTHAATFIAKTWTRIKNGNTGAKREELFLDEGLSHLAENLCGFDISGGNIKFLDHFFADTSMYSFCGVNRNGQEDSAGMRGAVTLFLSWLFWKSGGMSWDEINPVNLIDNGGISFLRRMIASDNTGRESIGAAFGKPVSQLFNEMLEEIHNYRVINKKYACRIDPLTKEELDFFVNMGTLNGITIHFPKLSNVTAHNTLLPWSIVYFDAFYVPGDGQITLYSAQNNGTAYYSVSLSQ